MSRIISSSISEEVPSSFNRREKYYFADFMRQMQNETYDSFVSLEEDFKVNVKRVLAGFLIGDGFYIKKLNEEIFFDQSKNIPDFEMSFFEVTTKGNKETKTIKKVSLRDLCKMPGFLVKYNSLVFKPKNDLENGDFNLWRGMRAYLVDIKKGDKKIIDCFTSYLREIWAAGNDEIFEYLQGWLAHLVQKPWEKTKVGLLLVSEQQQCGKNFLSNFIANYILGRDLVCEVAGVSAMSGKHNRALQGKLLNIINEASSVKDDFHANFDRIKNLLTDDAIMIEPKGIDSYSISNLGNFIFFSNHVHSVKIEDKDKRYMCTRVSEHRAGDFDYFDEVDSILNNSHAGNVIFTYLQKVKLINLREIPSTELKEEIKLLSMDSTSKFIHELKEDVFLYLKEHKMTEDNKVKASTFYEQYVCWCSRSGERATSRTRFGGIVKKSFSSKRTEKGVFYILE